MNIAIPMVMLMDMVTKTKKESKLKVFWSKIFKS